jgi:hypothetical protein
MYRNELDAKGRGEHCRQQRFAISAACIFRVEELVPDYTAILIFTSMVI